MHYRGHSIGESESVVSKKQLLRVDKCFFVLFRIRARRIENRYFLLVVGD